jgi:hypothetical protein
MKVWLFSELRDESLQEIDMTNESFVSSDEIVGYFNDAIHEAESEILKLHEDYMLTKGWITLVQGQSDYSLPSNIYAAKIRKAIYINGSLVYPVERVRDPDKFFSIELTNSFAPSDEYRYFIYNPDVDTGFQLSLAPAARESGNYLKLWYIRSAKRIPKIGEVVNAVTTTQTIQDNTKVDIPEFAMFLKEVFKGKCRAKDNGGVIPPDAVALIEQQRKMMIDTLTQMAPDNEDTIPGDMSHYYEHE